MRHSTTDDDQVRRNCLIKADLVKVVSERIGFSHQISQMLVNGIFEWIKGALLDMKSVKILRFGAFELQEKKARAGAGLGRQDRFVIPARKRVVFRPSRMLKALINDTTREKILPDRRSQSDNRG